MISVKDTFLSRRPPNTTKHLYIVISEIDDKVLIVGVTSHKPGKDGSCVLVSGDHPFIKHDSVISYKDAFETEKNHLATALSSGAINQRAAIADEVLEKILAGAKISPRLGRSLRAKYISEE
ncbi:MAG: hypothetical protein FVQ81_01110 [Candidatus Glassbacteria bacterium]|nr:hypothetical protein [Candidatus Glassbacteria bacterium]